MSDSTTIYAVGLFIGGAVGFSMGRVHRWIKGRKRP